MILLHFKVYFYLFDNIYKIYLLVWIISYIFVPTTKGKIITNYQNLNQLIMTILSTTLIQISACVSLVKDNHFIVKVIGAELKGRGILEKSKSILNTKKYLVSGKAYQKLQKQYVIKWNNVLC